MMKILERINNWFGFVKCPVCGAYLSSECAMVDGKATYGSWKTMICKCGSVVEVNKEEE